VDLRTPIEAPLEISFSAPQGLLYMQKMVNIKMCNAWGAKCNMMYDQEHSTRSERGAWGWLSPMRWGSSSGVAKSRQETVGSGAWEQTNGLTGVWRGR
jgi:hypothetical protein